jgi:hypothetical protein
MTASQTVMVCVLVAVLTASLVGMLYMLATDICREHYRRAGVRFDRHVDDAIEVTR